MPVAQINALATRFRVPYTAGDELTVRLVKEGREHGQAVGVPRRRHDGRGRAGGRADRLAGGGPRHERDPDHDRPHDLRRAARAGGHGRRRRLTVSRLRCFERGARRRDRDPAGRRRRPAARRRRAEGVPPDRRPAHPGGRGRRGRRVACGPRPRGDLPARLGGPRARAAWTTSTSPSGRGGRRDAPGLGPRRARRGAGDGGRRRRARRRRPVRAARPVHARARGGRGGSRRRRPGLCRSPTRCSAFASEVVEGVEPRDGTRAGADAAGVPDVRPARGAREGRGRRRPRSPTTLDAPSGPATRSGAIAGRPGQREDHHARRTSRSADRGWEPAMPDPAVGLGFDVHAFAPPAARSGSAASCSTARPASPVIRTVTSCATRSPTRCSAPRRSATWASTSPTPIRRPPASPGRELLRPHARASSPESGPRAGVDGRHGRVRAARRSPRRGSRCATASPRSPASRSIGSR